MERGTIERYLRRRERCGENTRGDTSNKPSVESNFKYGKGEKKTKERWKTYQLGRMF